MALKGDKAVATRRGDVSKKDYADRLVDAVDGVDAVDRIDSSDSGEATETARYQKRDHLLPLAGDAREATAGSDKDAEVTIEMDSHRKSLFLDDKGAEFGLLSLVLGVVSLVMFWVDVGSDLWLVFNYYIAGRYNLAWATLGIVLVSSLVTSAFGLHWYLVDLASNRRLQRELKRRQRPDLAAAIAVPPSLWLVRFLCTALQLGTFLRTVECLYYGWRSAARLLCWRSREGPGTRRLYGLWHQYEEADLSLLQLLEAFLESAPQLVFQLVVCLQALPTGDDVIRALPRYLGLVSSLVNLAKTIHSFHAAQRFSSNRRPLSIPASVLYVLWRLCEVAFRVLVLSVFTLTFYAYVLVPVGINVVLVFSWLLCQRTRVYRNGLLNTCFLLFASYIMVFCFLNLREGFSRWRYTLFYFYFYISNGALLVLWIHNLGGASEWLVSWVYYPLIAFFVCHLVFLLTYYKCCHPSGSIELCIPCGDTFCESVGAKRRTTDGHQFDPETLEEKRKLYIVASAIRERQRQTENGHESHRKHRGRHSKRHQGQKYEDTKGGHASPGKRGVLV